MKKRWFTKLTAVVISLLLLAGQAAMAIAAPIPQPVKISRTVSTNTTDIGSEFNINYTISGDEIIIPAPKTEIVVVIDCSITMDNTLSGGTARSTAEKKITIAKNAAKTFIEKFATSDTTKIAVVPYAYYAGNGGNVTDLLSTNSAANMTVLTNKCLACSAVGGTNTGDAFRIASDILSQGNRYANKYIVLLTDGEPNGYTYQYNGRNASKQFYMATDGRTVDSTNNSRNITGLLKYDCSMPASYDTGYRYSLEWANNVKSQYNTFMIGISQNDLIPNSTTHLTKDQAIQDVALAAGAAVVVPGRNYYKVTTTTEMDAAYNRIGSIIQESIPLNMTFTELLPVGITIIPAVKAELVANHHFTISDITYPDGTIRTSLTASLNGSLKKIGTTSDGDYRYQIDTTSIDFTILVKAVQGGNIPFEKDVTRLTYSYADPNNYIVSGEAINGNSSDLTVNLLSGGLSLAGKTTINVDETTTIQAITTTSDLDKFEWTMNSNPYVQIISITGDIVELKGCSTGSATLSASAESSNGYYNKVTTSCAITVLPTGSLTLSGIVLFKGQTVDLTAEASGLDQFEWSSSGTTSATFSAIGTANGSIKVYGREPGTTTITVTASAISGEYSPIPITRSCTINVIDVGLGDMVLLNNAHDPMNLNFTTIPVLPAGVSLDYKDWAEEGDILTKVQINAANQIKGITPSAIDTNTHFALPVTLSTRAEAKYKDPNTLVVSTANKTLDFEVCVVDAVIKSIPANIEKMKKEKIKVEYVLSKPSDKITLNTSITSTDGSNYVEFKKDSGYLVVFDNNSGNSSSTNTLLTWSVRGVKITPTAYSVEYVVTINFEGQYRTETRWIKVVKIKPDAF